ncbi:hypothetical protein CERSUDRAFT_89583 [Gelatoporia subvermispora B]|uniref:Uncharacterized protein n=1 Tax=Ceriporiopsis subvermispora (strain B) TaxID=914234 RepID=M2QYH7_CERS8|nr:hypothetical protein CERSUDRAFT_89583 [Gelatoporia subvermispora B]
MATTRPTPSATTCPPCRCNATHATNQPKLTSTPRPGYICGSQRGTQREQRGQVNG